MGRYKSLGSPNLFLSYAPRYLGPVACVFHILSSLGAHHREWLQSCGCSMAGILLPECPEGSPTHLGGLWSLMTVTSLFTDITGNFPLLTSLPDFIALHFTVFPGGSEVKASAWNAWDQGSIPGSGRSPGEGNGTLAWKIPWREGEAW